eukprot:5614632-Pleurochrysis_carterae.AAC.1
MSLSRRISSFIDLAISFLVIQAWSCFDSASPLDIRLRISKPFGRNFIPSAPVEADSILTSLPSNLLLQAPPPSCVRISYGLFAKRLLRGAWCARAGVQHLRREDGGAPLCRIGPSPHWSSGLKLSCL